MGLIARLKSTFSSEPGAEPKPAKESRDVDLSEGMGRLAAASDAAIAKAMSYQDYAAMEQQDASGGFFGREFAIRASATRLKALYTTEPWVFTTASLIARTLSMIPMKVYFTGTDTEAPKHPLNGMINGGSPWQSGRHQRWCGYLDLLLGGNLFLVADSFYIGLILAPVEVVSMDLAQDGGPPRGIVVSNPTGVGGGVARFPMQRVVHIKLPNPQTPFYGLSPFVAAARPVLLDRYKDEFEMAFYLRGATNNGVVETTQDLSRARFERLMRSFELAFTGKRNWWRTLFLPKGAVWKSASPTMKDMEHLEAKKLNQRTLLSVLGVPPSMVGLTEDVNHATSEAQLRVFYESTIIPYVGFIEDGYNSSQVVREYYRGKVEVRADLSSINAMREQSELATKGDTANKVARFFTINELRKKVFGEPPAPGGDVFALTAAPSVPGDPQDAPAADELTLDTPIAAAAPAPGPRLRLTEAVKHVQQEGVHAVERTFGPAFVDIYNRYLNNVMVLTVQALESKRDVAHHLHAYRNEMEHAYLAEALPLLERVMARGHSAERARKSVTARTKDEGDDGYTFTATDLQALDIVAEQKKRAREQALQRDVADRFQGFSKTRTDQILGLIDDGARAGKTLTEIAADIRLKYGEAYPDQAFTIARTEVLSAMSAGTKGAMEDLSDLFGGQITKQWVSLGDDRVREDHEGFEALGEVAIDFEFAPGLKVPRDYGGEPGQVINCRCSLVTNVPSSANSRASAILDSETP